jgi:Tfp pilus assembly protein PilF
VHDLRLKDDARSSELYGRALDCVADFPPSLDALARILERRGDWASLAAMLRRAADVCKESNEVVSFTYRAARILADRVGDPVQAAALLRRGGLRAHPRGLCRRALPALYAARAAL